MDPDVALSWPGSICRDFEDDENDCLRLTSRLLRSSLAPRARRSAGSLDRSRRQLSSLLSEQLIRLDLHAAGLKFDRRRLRNTNFGLGEFISQISRGLTASGQALTDEVERTTAEFADAERRARDDAARHSADLEGEVAARVREAEDAEAEARRLRAQSQKIGARARDYERWREWITLNDEQAGLAETEQQLEAACRDAGKEARADGDFGRDTIARRRTPMEQPGAGFPPRGGQPWGARSRFFV
jgi:hypothetical protein